MATSVPNVSSEPAQQSPTLAEFRAQNALDRRLLGYRSSRFRANLTVTLLVIGVVSSVISIALAFSQIELIDRILSGQFVANSDLEDSDANVKLAAWLGLAVYAVTVIVFAMWIYLVSSNLESLSTRGQRFSPGWAVGWWFVPIMNLWRPYQVVKEIWKGSDPDMVGEKAERWEQASAWPFLGWWWGVWVIGGIVGWSSFSSSVSAETLQSVKDAAQISIFTDVLFIVTSILAIFLVKYISERQDHKYEALIIINRGIAIDGGPTGTHMGTAR